MSTYTTLNFPELEAFKATSKDAAPIYMLNMLRFRQRATYNPPQSELPEVSGREAYHNRYLPAIKLHIKDVSLKFLLLGKAHAALCGPVDEKWDEVLIVEYPNFEAFVSLATSEVYQTMCNPHREAAIEDFRLIPITGIDI